MEFRNEKLIALLLVTASFVDFINSVCIIDNDIYPSEFWYNCVGSADYVSDVKRAPIDVLHVSFSMSNIPIIRNGVLSRFAQNLTTLDVVTSGVKEIEDNAFHDLAQLSILNLDENELEIVKEAWFKGLPNLETIVLSHNKIRYIEQGFFLAVSPLDQLFIDSNELTCISASALSRFHVKKLQYELNPWSWKCRSIIIDWFEKKRPVIFDRYHYDDWFLAKNVIRNCIVESPEPEPTDDFMNNCVKTKSLQWLPTTENYTALQICEMRDNPSPFLWCEFDL